MRRTSQAFAALALSATLGVSVAPAAIAGTEPTRPPTDRYCDTFSDYFVVTLMVEFFAQLATAFSQLPDSQTATTAEPELDIEQIRSTMLVMLSPKFVALTRSLGRSGSASLRREFRRERRIFARGVEILEDAGVTPEQIEAIANAEVNQSTYEIENLTDEVDLTDAETDELGRKFLPHSKQLELGDLDAGGAEEFEGIAVACGTVPSSDVDCEEVFSMADAADVVGREVTKDDADGCRYVGVEEGVGLAPEVAVVVYDSDRAFDTLTEPVGPISDDVEGIGDRAVSFDGYSASGKDRTCGRTLVFVDDDRTIVTALCLADDEPVEDERLVKIAEGVLDRLG
jgi:hypothetical protein